MGATEGPVNLAGAQITIKLLDLLTGSLRNKPVRSLVSLWPCLAIMGEYKPCSVNAARWFRIGEVVSGLGGPVSAIPAASPQARQSHLRPVAAPTLKRIDYSGTVRSDEGGRLGRCKKIATFALMRARNTPRAQGSV